LDYKGETGEEGYPGDISMHVHSSEVQWNEDVSSGALSARKIQNPQQGTNNNLGLGSDSLLKRRS
jgi:hypothetical protein